MPAVGAAGDAAKKSGDEATGAGSKWGAFGEIMTGALRQVGAVAVDALGKAAQATGAFLADSVNLAGDFQQGMLEFQAVAGKDVDTAGLEKFHDLFLQLGKDLPVSTADVQQAAIEMVKGGIDPAIVAAGGLRQNIQFAAAAMSGDLAGAAEISAKILGGWADANATAADKAAFLTHSTDLLTKAANASSVDAKELSLGIFNAQGIAKAAGVSFDDLTTTLAALAPRFASSSEAGTSLKNMIVRLQPQTKAATGAMQALGLYTEETGSVFYDAQGNFVGFAKASELLKNATRDLTNEQRSQLLQTIFGNDAMGAASALAEMGATGYNNMADALAKANGVAENAALKQQGYNTALENAKGSVEALKITLGEQLLPILTSLLNDYIAPGINAITSFGDALFAAHAATGSWTLAIDQFLPGFQSLYDTGVQVAGFISDNLGPIISSIAAMILTVAVPAFVSWATAAGAAAATTIAALLPVIAPIVAIGAAAAALYAAWDSDFLGIRTALTDFWDRYGEPIFEDIKGWLAKTIPAAISTVSGFFTGTLLPALSSIWSFLSTYVIPIFEALFKVQFAVAQKVIEALAGTFQNVLLPAFTAASNYLGQTFQPALAAIGDFISGTLGPIFDSFSSWLGDVTGGFEGISGAVQGLIKWLSDLAEKISNMKLPDWATPGSPTPAEIGFKGMANALRTQTIPEFKSLISTLQVAPVASPTQIAASGARQQVANYYGPVGPQYSMPVYTSQSPAVVQQGYHTLRALSGY